MNRNQFALITVAGLMLGACGQSSNENAAQPSDQPSSSAAPSANSMTDQPAGADMDQAADAARDVVDDAAAQAEQAAAQVTDQMRAAMTGYLEQMSAAIGSLEGIEDRMSAAAKAPELRGIIEQMQGFREQLVALPDDALTALRAEFDAQLSGLAQRLQTEIDRIASNPDLAGALGGLLDQIPTSLG